MVPKASDLRKSNRRQVKENIFTLYLTTRTLVKFTENKASIEASRAS